MLEHKNLEKGASFQKRLDDLGITEGKARDDWNRMLVTTEGEARRALRRPLTQLLAGPQMRKLEGVIRQIVEDVLDEIEDPTEVDLMDEVAWKIPSRVYCHLVAAPIEHAPIVAQLSDRALAPILTGNTDRRQDSIDAFYETLDFVRVHLDERRRQGLGEDFSSIMIRQRESGLQTEEELYFEGIALLQASVDNTVHQIGMMLGTLLEDAPRWEKVVQDPALVQPAVEEAMRLAPRFNTIFRYARHETDFNGLSVPADTWVYLSIRAANRDSGVFNDPPSFRFDRGMNRTLQFGGGPYNCLGQILARVELQAVLHALRDRFPRGRLTEAWVQHETNAVNEVTRLRAALR
ncbi:MAG: cytochrome P450 [Mesorhizobium sp.]